MSCRVELRALAFPRMVRHVPRAIPAQALPKLGVVGIVLGLLLPWACLPRTDGPYKRQTDDDAGPQDPVDLDAGAVDDTRDLPDAAPHAVLTVTPNHGPFSGGQTVLIRGNGFASNLRVWLGDERVGGGDVLPVDASRVQVTVPQGNPGTVDVTVQNGSDASTRATLPQGYVYDSFYLEPDSGPTSGGTVVTLHGASTKWDKNTEVLIDLKPCLELELLSETELRCKTPEGTAGSKNVRVTTADDVEVDVLDAFVYGDSDNGFRGGLSGQPFDGELTVTALDNFTGSAIGGATVIVSSPDGDDVEIANSRGSANFSVGQGEKRTVTVAAECFSPVTFVDVPVDTVVAYLDPVLDISCADFDDLPRLPGSASSSGSTVRGELLWPSRSSEFGRDGWSNVPAPEGDDERWVAYVFRASSTATQPFRLPSSSSAVTPTAAGEVGYNYYIGALPGNATYYALAGIENRALNPPRFTAYAMGVAPGVTTRPDTTTTDVFINVDVPLDHTLTLEVTPPRVTPRGPDRLEANAVIRISEAGYAILPVSRQTHLLPGAGRFDFVGLPPLTGSLAGAKYVTYADAVTGVDSGLPQAFGGLFSTTDTSRAVPLDNFVEVPELLSPAEGSRWSGQHLEVDWAPGGAAVDLVVFSIESGGGLVTWTIVAPGTVKNIDLPDLRALAAQGALESGALELLVTAAQIREFDYGSLRYRQLGPSGFDAFSRDRFRVSY